MAIRGVYLYLRLHALLILATRPHRTPSVACYGILFVVGLLWICSLIGNSA